MKVIKGDFKGGGRKDELYQILEELPAPPAQAALSEGQLIWWNWAGKLMVETGRFIMLDLMHLQSLAAHLEWRNRLIKEINRKNHESSNGIGGMVMIHPSGARQISAEMTALKHADQKLDKLSIQFGMSFYDRLKLSPPKEADPNQTSLWDEFNDQKLGS